MHIYLCYISCYLLNSSFDQRELFQVGFYSSWKCPIIIFTFVVPSFLIPQNAPGSSWVIPATFFFFFKKQTIFSRNPGSFYWIMIFRNQDMNSGCVCLLLLRMSLLLALSNKCLCANPSNHDYFCMSSSLNVY